MCGTYFYACATVRPGLPSFGSARLGSAFTVELAPACGRLQLEPALARSSSARLSFHGGASSGLRPAPAPSWPACGRLGSAPARSFSLLPAPAQLGSARFSWRSQLRPAAGSSSELTGLRPARLSSARLGSAYETISHMLDHLQ